VSLQARTEDIRQRAANATHGPWFVLGDSVYYDDEEDPDLNDATPIADMVGFEWNRQFIAHSRGDIPFLLKRVEELEEENKSISISETHHATLLSDCEMENERLRTQLQKRDEQLAEIQKGGGFGAVDVNFTGFGGEFWT
jgi:hypothetical protein